MAGNKYVSNVAGVLTEIVAVQAVATANAIVALNSAGILDPVIVNSVITSAGAGSSGKVVALDGAGRIANNMMPVGIGTDTATIVTSENLSAGDYVNIYNNATVFTARKADATTAGKEAHGFVLAATTSPSSAIVYFEGSNTSVTGQTAGNVFLSATAGLGTATAPTTAAQVVQRIGFATSATVVNFQSQPPITLA